MRLLVTVLFISSILVSGVALADRNALIKCSPDTPHDCE